MKKNRVIFRYEGFDVRQYTGPTRAPRRRIFTPNGVEWLHRYIANKYIKKLKPGDVVHHKDGNPLNDNLDNLAVMSRAKHMSIHKPMLGYRFTEEQKKNLSDAHMGQRAWNKGLRGFKHSEKSKLNMSRAMKGRKITWGAKITEAKTKVTRDQLVNFLKDNPTSTAKDIMKAFGLKSKGPIHKNGGLKKLKKEAAR